MKVRPSLFVAAVALLALGFAWGFFSHRQRLFPFALIRSAAAAANLVVERPVPHRPPPNEKALLSAIGYVDGSFDAETRASGVIHYEPELAWPGLNFYNTSARSDEARLVDMEGRLVHRWQLPGTGWMHASLLPNGDVLAVEPNQRIVRVDRNSELIWELEGAFHHGLWVTGDGHILALAKSTRFLPELHPSFSVRDDDVVELDAGGRELGRFSLLDGLLASQFRYLLPNLQGLELEPDLLETPVIDLLHTNHVEVFDGTQEARSQLFAAGNLLVSLRNLNTVAILDRASHRFLWAWGPNNLGLQHHPTLLDAGTLLIFNNGRNHSQVLELDPLDLEVVWSYSDKDFFSRTRGSNQRLANGNTLITESDSGHVLEVTPDGNLVWEFANPDHTEDGKRLVIWRMTRFAASDLPFLGPRP